MSTSFFARILDDPYVGAHAAVIIFAGPDAEHRANVGQLVMRYEEADALVALFEKAEADRLQQQKLDALDEAMRPWIEKGSPS